MDRAGYAFCKAYPALFLGSRDGPIWSNIERIGRINHELPDSSKYCRIVPLLMTWPRAFTGLWSDPGLVDTSPYARITAQERHQNRGKSILSEFLNLDFMHRQSSLSRFSKHRRSTLWLLQSRARTSSPSQLGMPQRFIAVMLQKRKAPGADGGYGTARSGYAMSR